MAFYNQDDEEQDPNAQQGGGVQTSPGSAIISGEGGSSSPQPAGSPDKGGNFVGLTTYLNANKNQAGKLGQQTAGVISNSANAARDSVSGLNSQFNQAVDQNTITQDHDAMGMIGTTPESLSDQQKNQVKKQYSATYKGPNALSELGDSYTQTLKSTNQANQNLQDAGTEAGRGNLIKQINSAPRTKGVTTFDNILLQTGPGRDKLLDVANQNADVKDLMSGAESAAQQKVGMLDDPNTPDIDESAGAKGTTAKTQADTFKAVQDALAAWQSGFDPKLAAAKDTALQDRITSDLTNGDDKLSDETLQLLGINHGDYINRDLLPSYLQPFSPTDVTSDNFASAEDYARYGALADIAGIQDPFLKKENIAKAGTAPKFELKSAAADTPKAKAIINSYNNDRGMFNQRPITDMMRSPDGNNWTIKEAEESIIPMLDSHGQYGISAAFRTMIDNWKKTNGYNKIFKA